MRSIWMRSGGPELVTIMRWEFRPMLEDYLAHASASRKTLAEIVEYYESHPETMMKYGDSNLRAALDETPDGLQGEPYLKAMEIRKETIAASRQRLVNISPEDAKEDDTVKYPWIDEYLMAKRGVTKDLQAEWNWIRYHIGRKMFAAVLLDDHDQPYYINLKLEPMEGELMRQQYPDIIPGYYSNKQHWNSIKPDGEIPDDLLKHWLDRSYDLILKGFPKQKQREILGLSVCGTDCSACTLHGSVCTGCNEACGKVFHANGKACLIYACCANKYRFTNCASCDRIPCEIWQATRDPSMTDEQFRKSIEDRVSALKN